VSLRKTKEEIMKGFIQKIEFQWTTIKKAFHEINLSKSGKI